MCYQKEERKKNTMVSILHKKENKKNLCKWFSKSANGPDDPILTEGIWELKI